MIPTWQGIADSPCLGCLESVTGNSSILYEVFISIRCGQEEDEEMKKMKQKVMMGWHQQLSSNPNSWLRFDQKFTLHDSSLCTSWIPIGLRPLDLFRYDHDRMIHLVLIRSGLKFMQSSEIEKIRVYEPIVFTLPGICKYYFTVYLMQFFQVFL